MKLISFIKMNHFRTHEIIKTYYIALFSLQKHLFGRIQSTVTKIKFFLDLFLF